MTEPLTPEAEAFADAQRTEWGTYVANLPILHQGVRAYNAGDPVPVSNVIAHGYLDTGQVRKADQPAPEQAEQSVVYPVGDPIEVNAPDAASVDNPPADESADPETKD